jgi:hypothetical protein
VFTNKTGETKLHEEQISEFVKAVGTPHDGIWNEKITQTNIQIDGNLAHAWTTYEFYVDDRLYPLWSKFFSVGKIQQRVENHFHYRYPKNIVKLSLIIKSSISCLFL